MSQFAAVTITANGGRLRDIITDAEVSPPFDPKVDKNPPSHTKTKALWDTGASSCAITKTLAGKVGLLPTGKVDVHHAAGVTERNVYLLNVALPNGVVIPMVRATECDSTAGSFELIIGMDIITLGDFSITNEGGITKMSYRIPSQKHIDYVEELNRVNKSRNSIGRNDPCYCGSKIKFKHCHGK